MTEEGEEMGGGGGGKEERERERLISAFAVPHFGSKDNRF